MNKPKPQPKESIGVVLRKTYLPFTNITREHLTTKKVRSALNPHLLYPRNIDALESENRKIWQSPEEILDKIETKPPFIVRARIRISKNPSKEPLREEGVHNVKGRSASLSLLVRLF